MHSNNQMNMTNNWANGGADQTILETRLRQRGISMGDFYGPLSTVSNNPYKTEFDLKSGATSLAYKMPAE